MPAAAPVLAGLSADDEEEEDEEVSVRGLGRPRSSRECVGRGFDAAERTATVQRCVWCGSAESFSEGVSGVAVEPIRIGRWIAIPWCTGMSGWVHEYIERYVMMDHACGERS